VAELGGHLSVLARQKRDHVELGRLLTELDHTAAAAQGPVLRRIHRLVFPHAFAEESVLWPVFRRLIPDGPALTLRIEQEHQEINELATQLENLPLDADERPRVLHRLTGLLHDDVRDEEDQLLPRIQDRLSPTQVRLLGAAWEVVRRTAPTRPHPVVARRPPGNVLAALPLSIIDRLRDRVDAAAGRRPGPRPRLAAVSRRLTGVAHRVERWAPFRRGEDPRTARD
jgi:hemerythrin superfamily protein